MNGRVPKIRVLEMAGTGCGAPGLRRHAIGCVRPGYAPVVMTTRKRASPLIMRSNAASACSSG